MNVKSEKLLVTAHKGSKDKKACLKKKEFGCDILILVYCVSESTFARY